MKRVVLFPLVLSGLILGVACDDPNEVYDNAYDREVRREEPDLTHGEATTGRGRLSPPVEITEAEQVARQALETGQVRGGGRGGGGNSPESERYLDLADQLTDQQAHQLYMQITGNMRLQDSNDPCGRAFAAYEQFARETNDPSPMSEEAFREQCGDTAPDQVMDCLRDPEDRNAEQNEICEQLFGVDDLLRQHRETPDPGRLRTPGGEPAHAFRQSQQQRARVR